MKFAIIGSGISGLSAAYSLSKKYKVDLFEKEDHFGGHSHTIDVNVGDNIVPVDIGFIVFNKKTYPNLINFFQENDIAIEESNMSFSVSVRDSNIEYCGKGLSGIFSNKSNLLNIKFLKMFFTIISFYKQSESQDPINENITLGSYLDSLKLSDYFIKFHIIPMVSAIWSMPPYEAKQMPLKFFFKFFQNHGLFKLKDRPQWFTVSKRSRTYVDKILSKISGEYYKNYNINKIKRIGSGVMPNNKSAWCSWNSSIESENSEKNSITYWLNLLQNLNINKNIFLTLNPYLEIPEEKIIRKVIFTHPYFDQNAINSQKDLHLIQNKNNILFCGSYFGYGFHEDGIKSSIDMIKYINA